MAEIKKLTKKDYFNELKELVSDRQDLVDFIDHEIELLSKKSSSTAPTKSQVENENIKKLYVSVSSRIYSNGSVLMTKRDMRFIRRLIRDYYFRDSSVENTSYLWKGVRMGEDRYLFPFSDRADIRIDSIHPYEVCIFKDIAIKLLDHIGSDSIYYHSASELKDKLSHFISLSEGDVPVTSLLKEFIG